MSFPDDAISALNRYLPEFYRIPNDRRQWWAVQVCAHAALILVFSTLLLCVRIWVPDADMSLNSSFILQSGEILIPALVWIQGYYVPMYVRHLSGRTPLWKFFGGTLSVVVIGLLLYPIYRHFLSETGAQIMVFFASAVSALMFAEAFAMHVLFKWWLARNRPRDDLLPPLSGHL